MGRIVFCYTDSKLGFENSCRERESVVGAIFWWNVWVIFGILIIAGLVTAQILWRRNERNLYVQSDRIEGTGNHPTP